MGIKVKSLAEASGFEGGQFFKAAEYATTTLLIIEPKSWKHNATNEYNGNLIPRDEAIADITVFETEEQLKAGEPAELLKEAILTNKALVTPCKTSIGEAFLVSRVTKKSGKGGAYYAFDDIIHRSHQDYAIAYLEEREAKKQAALDDMPDFD